MKRMRTKFRGVRGAQSLLHDLRMKIDMWPHPFRVTMQQHSRYFALQVIADLLKLFRGVLIALIFAERNCLKESDQCLVVDGYKGLILDSLRRSWSELPRMVFVYASPRVDCQLVFNFQWREQWR